MRIKMYYSPINNMGDDLNRLIMEDVFNQELDPNFRVDNFDVMGIGSCLDVCFYGHKKENSIKLIGKKISSQFFGAGHIWGTGFIDEYPFEQMKLIRNELRFDVVRGELTRRGISQILGYNLEVPLADGGLLAPKLLKDKLITKSKMIGIVPHYKDKNEADVLKLQKMLGREALLIDVQGDTLNVIEQIASCDYIISSSLHGLIVADSFGIPNTRIKFSNNMLGTGFKFDDYYSSFGMVKPAVSITDGLFNQEQVVFADVLEKQAILMTSMREIIESKGVVSE